MSERDRRDWSLLVFIVPLGILLMLIAGQFAMRIIPQWILDVGMGSRLEVETAGGQQTVLKPLFNIGILTPFSWQNTYLTPNANSGFVFPPFIVLEPSATPSPTIEPPPTETSTPPVTVVSPSATTVTSSATIVVTATTPPPPKDTSTPATETPTATPTTETPTATPTTETPTATPTTETPTATPTTETPTATPPTATPVFIPTDYTEITPPNIGTEVPDGNSGGIADRSYVIMNFSGTPVIVGIPDNYYELIFYEDELGSSGAIHLDQIIIGITNDINFGYYEVFNWGNNNPDTNTNADINTLPPDTSPSCTEPECDNYQISTTDLYPDPAGTGILIDVDTAPAPPPPDSYNYVVLISPFIAGSSGNSAQVDAIVVTEVPIPTPTP